eukprot:COSAG05_NODE_12736_length_456_cov_1.434174_1_plen_72_part_10
MVDSESSCVFTTLTSRARCWWRVMLQFKGKLSLETAGADMMAVVSRRAIVVGSCPGGRQAQEGGDIVAYHSL